MIGAMERPVRVRIEAPDAAKAFELERRLVYRKPTAVGHGAADWEVDLDADERRIDEIVLTVRHWLEDEGLTETLVHTNGTTRHVRATR